MQVNLIDIDYDAIKSYIAGDSHKGHEIWGALTCDDGYIFRVYAPNADSVYIQGDFTNWENIQMTKNVNLGYFFIKLPAKVGDYYKYAVVKDGNWVYHADPFGKAMDYEGDFATLITDDSYDFNDLDFIEKRDKNFDKALNIYELHIGSWLRYGGNVNFLDIVDKLIDHVKKMNYTHVEIMPVTEYPFYPSWGYQSTGFFATSARYGRPVDFKKFVDLLHQNGIGVILDLVAVHFANDYYGLKTFDGTHLYESPYDGLTYSEWGSVNFDYSKGHVRSFMKSSFAYWIENFHIDGIRVDAVSYMIYYNGNENRGVHYDNINFIKDANKDLQNSFPDVMLIAEDSSAYPKVTSPVDEDGLGFDYKWDLGWMNDTTKYFKVDSYNRSHHHSKITFSMFYFYNERFMLPLSHDEVVHMKGAMVNKMSGSYEDKFKELKVLYTYQMAHPGKMLNFMGNEIATFDEWNENASINWDILSYPKHDDFNRYLKDLNYLYKENDAFFKYDYNEAGFRWIIVDDANTSVFAFERIADDKRFLVVLNMANLYHGGYEFPYDEDLIFIERLNSFDQKYGGARDNLRKIEVKKGSNLKLELWEYEAAIFEIRDNEKTN